MNSAPGTSLSDVSEAPHIYMNSAGFLVKLHTHTQPTKNNPNTKTPVPFLLAIKSTLIGMCARNHM